MQTPQQFQRKIKVLIVALISLFISFPAQAGFFSWLKSVNIVENSYTPKSSSEKNHAIPLATKVSTTSASILASIPDTEISGTVYEDYDFNGSLNQTDTTGIQGIEIYLTNKDSSFTQSTLTDVNGNYQFTGLTTGEEYRIEFILPASISSIGNSSLAGTESGTTVQFVQAGNCANLGIVYPGICPPPYDYTTELGDLFPLSRTLLGSGVGFVSCGVFSNIPQADRWAVGLMDMRSIATDNTRSQIMPDMYHHPSWHIDSIGNTFGLDVDTLGNMYVAASTHYGASFGYQGDNAVIQFGIIGGGFQDLNAAGTIYKLDAQTGQASVFSVLPQQSLFYSHESCESTHTIDRTSGVGLGNLVFDRKHLQFFVSNFEDGKIYRIDLDGNILNSFDPQTLTGFAVDDNSAGPASDAIPYGLAISPDGSQLFFGTNELDETPNLYSVNLSTTGDFSGTEVLHGEFMGEGDLGFIFATDPSWIAISDLEFLPNGSLMLGLRTGCAGSYFTSHNHGGNFYIMEASDPDGLFNDLVISPDIQYANDFVLGNTDGSDYTSNDDGYGGIGIWDKHDGSWDYILTSADIIDENGPHGMIVFPHDFTHSGNGTTEYTLQPSAAISYFPSLIPNDIKGVGGDIVVFNGCEIIRTEIGNRVWYDEDNDGIQDAGEPGIPGINVSLYADDGTLIATTITDANGNYSFSWDGQANQIWSTPDDWVQADSTYYVLFGESQLSNDTLQANGYDYLVTIDSVSAGINGTELDSDIELLSNLTGGLAILNGLPGTQVFTSNGGDVVHNIDLGLSKIKYYDWGDLPDGSTTTSAGDYQTDTLNNGPFHEIITGFFLGTSVDKELNGQQSSIANGDDNNGDDEDGLTFQSNQQMLPGGTIKLPLLVANPTTDTAHVEMWIDWNNDGDFDDANEMVADLNDGNGATPFPTFLTINIPTNAVQNENLGLRIRLSNEDNMTPYGLANSGEVEDYVIQLSCMEACLNIFVSGS